MDKRFANVIINNVGGNSSTNAKGYKISLPTSWIKELNINKNNRRVELIFDGEKIIIQPVQSLENFIQQKKTLKHKLIIINYYDKEFLCSTIAADFSDKTIKHKDFTDDLIKTAFGINQNPNWIDFENFLKERCIPKSRAGLREYLDSINIDHFDTLEIIKKTHGHMAEDNMHIEFEELK